MKIEGLAAIVTGGASGLGGATARMLADKGARVTIFDLNPELGEQHAADIGGRFQSVNVADDEAVAAANDTDSGLAAYFYTRDVGRIFRVMEGLEYGMVGVNTGLISTELAPFGGIKESGNSREGSHHGIEEFMEMKYLCMSV